LKAKNVLMVAELLKKGEKNEKDLEYLNKQRKSG
tara:strand:- start:606 stop:707 length:102 start_codon:yes stop_codon:yes gene_type:complete